MRLVHFDKKEKCWFCTSEKFNRIKIQTRKFFSFRFSTQLSYNDLVSNKAFSLTLWISNENLYQFTEIWFCKTKSVCTPKSWVIVFCFSSTNESSVIDYTYCFRIRSKTDDCCHLRLIEIHHFRIGYNFSLCRAVHISCLFYSIFYSWYFGKFHIIPKKFNWSLSTHLDLLENSSQFQFGFIVICALNQMSEWKNSTECYLIWWMLSVCTILW